MNVSLARTHMFPKSLLHPTVKMLSQWSICAAHEHRHFHWCSILELPVGRHRDQRNLIFTSTGTSQRWTSISHQQLMSGRTIGSASKAALNTAALRLSTVSAATLTVYRQHHASNSLYSYFEKPSALAARNPCVVGQFWRTMIQRCSEINFRSGAKNGLSYFCTITLRNTLEGICFFW